MADKPATHDACPMCGRVGDWTDTEPLGLPLGIGNALEGSIVDEQPRQIRAGTVPYEIVDETPEENPE
jgi:hypothetical protein